MPEATVPPEKAEPKAAEAVAPSPEEAKAAAERLKAAEAKALAERARDRQFLEAAKKGNVSELKELLGKGASLYAHDDGNTALFYAAQYGRMDAVVFLLQQGIPLESKNRIGSTPLAGAAGSGHKEVARLLYDLGADPFLKNYTGPQSTPYSYAKGAGYNDVAEMLRQPRNVDDVTFTRQTGDITLQEIFNFAHADRLTVVRRGADGPVEAIQRDSFADLTDKAALRKAFDTYAQKGGKRPATDFFPEEAKPAPVAEPPKQVKKSWLPWKRG